VFAPRAAPHSLYRSQLDRVRADKDRAIADILSDTEESMRNAEAAHAEVYSKLASAEASMLVIKQQLEAAQRAAAIAEAERDGQYHDFASEREELQAQLHEVARESEARQFAVEEQLAALQRGNEENETVLKGLMHQVCAAGTDGR